MNPQINQPPQPSSTPQDPTQLPGNTPPQPENDPMVFIAQQVMLIKKSLEDEISEIRDQVSTLIQGEAKYQKEMDDFKKTLKDIINAQ